MERFTIPKDTLTFAEACQYLDVTAEALATMTKRHKIDYFVSAAGNHKYFDLEKLRAWCRHREVKSDQTLLEEIKLPKR